MKVADILQEAAGDSITFIWSGAGDEDSQSQIEYFDEWCERNKPDWFFKVTPCVIPPSSFEQDERDGISVAGAPDDIKELKIFLNMRATSRVDDLGLQHRPVSTEDTKYLADARKFATIYEDALDVAEKCAFVLVDSTFKMGGKSAKTWNNDDRKQYANAIEYCGVQVSCAGGLVFFGYKT